MRTHFGLMTSTSAADLLHVHLAQETRFAFQKVKCLATKRCPDIEGTKREHNYVKYFSKDRL